MSKTPTLSRQINRSLKVLGEAEEFKRHDAQIKELLRSNEILKFRLAMKTTENYELKKRVKKLESELNAMEISSQKRGDYLNQMSYRSKIKD